jgi:preprotein translocase subunit YajC
MLYAFLTLFPDEVVEKTKDALEKAKDGPPNYAQFLPLVLLFALFYFLMIRPMQKQRKEQESLLSALKKNDEVVTSGGILGTVWSIKEGGEEVTLKLEGDTKIRVLKSSIVRILNNPAAPSEGTSAS